MTLDRIAATLRETGGLEADALGARHLAAAVDRLRARRGLDREPYAELVAADAEAREALIAELLVHETSFFRYPASFAHLAAFAVERAASRPGPVRVLCAACATGQEAISAAIALLEAGLPPDRVVVDAFDRSSAAIEHARAGRFDRGGRRGLDAARVERWFASAGGVATLVPAVRTRVRFEQGDLLGAARPFANGTYDAVFCRNLLIYLTEPARRRALAVLRAALAPGGVLYLGHAEVLVARAEGFVPVAAAATYATVAGSAEDVARRSSPPASRSSQPAPPARAARRVEPAARTAAVATEAAPVAAPPAVGALARARDLADAGRLAEASALLEAEIAKGRPLADHYHLLALVRRAAGRPGEADEALVRALYLDPQHVDALLLAAVLAEGRGERGIAARLQARARAAVRGRG